MTFRPASLHTFCIRAQQFNNRMQNMSKEQSSFSPIKNVRRVKTNECCRADSGTGILSSQLERCTFKLFIKDATNISAENSRRLHL